MRWRAAGLLLVLLALLALASAWHRHPLQVAEAGTVPVAGGDGGGLPRAAAEAEGFDAHSLGEAAGLARAQGSSALLVLRHGHLVYEQYAGGADAATLVDGGELADVLVMLAARIAAMNNALVMPPGPGLDRGRLAAAIAAASHLGYPQFLSRNVWQQLNAAPARWSPTTMRARAGDWLRVAEVLLHDGRFEGTQLIPGGWSQQLVRPTPAPGSEAYAASDMACLRGPGATRLWLAPSLDLAVLRVAPAPATGAIDEARLVNMIVRAVRDRPATGGVSLNDLVFGH